MTRKELMKALIKGMRLEDLNEYEPGLSCNGGRYSFTYRLDREFKLWVICSYEGSKWEQISGKLLETWDILRGIDWSEKAIWIESPRWIVQ